ncbi:MAG: hypothetical protein IKO61_04370, partial [Lachnospiraceae bacterium]|nr:hypothetical protein [Lachnospiraceae bacterium]
DENNSEGKQECLNITIVCNEIKNLAKPYYTWLARFFACEKLSKTGLYNKYFIMQAFSCTDSLSATAASTASSLPLIFPHHNNSCDYPI